MMIISIICLCISILLFAGTVFVVLRLNTYIGKLESTVQKQIELTENLMQSMREVVAEDYLQNDGRLKKFTYQKERNMIVNGISATEDIEI